MKVFITKKIPQAGIELMEQFFEVEIFEEDMAIPREVLLEKVQGVDAVLSLLTDKIDAEVMDRAGENLKIIANYAVGFENIDLDEAKKRNITVTNTPGVLTQAVAEFTASLITSLTKRITEADRFTRTGNYKGWEPQLMMGMELKGKILGLIGTGRIGCDVGVKMFKGFGMRIVYHDIKPNPELYAATDAEKLSFDEVLRVADVVSLHVPLNSATKHMLEKNQFDMMKETAFIINTARGPVINENDLAWALRENQIAGAALDVYEFEPHINDELKTMQNVILTPHIASSTVETRNSMARMAAENIIAVLNGEAPLSKVEI